MKIEAADVMRFKMNWTKATTSGHCMLNDFKMVFQIVGRREFIQNAGKYSRIWAYAECRQCRKVVIFLYHIQFHIKFDFTYTQIHTCTSYYVHVRCVIFNIIVHLEGNTLAQMRPNHWAAFFFCFFLETIVYKCSDKRYMMNIYRHIKLLH